MCNNKLLIVTGYSRITKGLIDLGPGNSANNQVKTDLLENSPKLLPLGFHQLGYEDTENMFYFIYKINIFRLNKRKDVI